jgi:hypothetical protein
MDPVTGTTTNIATGPSLDFSLYNQSVHDGGACTCTNAVLQVPFDCCARPVAWFAGMSGILQADYVVKMASPNVVSSVSLSIVLADLSTGSVIFHPFSNGFMCYVCWRLCWRAISCAAGSVPRRFSVAFQSSGATDSLAYRYAPLCLHFCGFCLSRPDTTANVAFSCCSGPRAVTQDIWQVLLSVRELL